MRQWRVGTISLGIILMGCGGALLAWLLSGQPTPVLYLRWWPLILVVLALEILASTLPRKDEEPHFKYDGASIMLITMITVGSFALSLLSGLGIMEQVAAELTGSAQYQVLEPRQVSIPAGVRRIVVVTRSGEARLVTAASNSCTIQGELRGFGSSDQWRDVVMAIKPSMRVIGDMLWLELPEIDAMSRLGQQVHDARYEIVVPQDMPVEIDCRDYTRLELRPHQLQKDWMVKGDCAEVSITASVTDALRVQALDRDHSELGGNVTWQESGGMATALIGSDKTTISIFSQGPVAVYRQ